MTPGVWREAVNHEGQRSVEFGAEGAVAAFAGDLAAITQEIRTGVVLQQVYRVDDGDHGVSSRATSERELPSSSRKSKVVATGSGSPTPVDEGGFACGRDQFRGAIALNLCVIQDRMFSGPDLVCVVNSLAALGPEVNPKNDLAHDPLSAAEESGRNRDGEHSVLPHLGLGHERSRV
jgi:hypothetical protein